MSTKTPWVCLHKPTPVAKSVDSADAKRVKAAHAREMQAVRAAERARMEVEYTADLTQAAIDADKHARAEAVRLAVQGNERAHGRY